MSHLNNDTNKTVYEYTCDVDFEKPSVSFCEDDVLILTYNDTVAKDSVFDIMAIIQRTILQELSRMSLEASHDCLPDPRVINLPIRKYTIQNYAGALHVRVMHYINYRENRNKTVTLDERGSQAVWLMHQSIMGKCWPGHPTPKPTHKDHRYKIGERVIFANYVFANDYRPSGYRPFYPWECSVLKDIDIIPMTCVKHHWVPSGQCEDNRHHGYHFQDDQKRIWWNEYPRAQREHFSGESAHSVHLAKQYFDPENEETWTVFMDVTWLVGNIVRDIRHYEYALAQVKSGRQTQYLPEIELNSRLNILKTHLDRVCDSVKAQTGATVQVESWAYSPGADMVEYAGIPLAKLFWPQTEEVLI